MIKEKKVDYNDSLFIKVLEVEKTKKDFINKILKENFNGFKGLTHYELLRYKNKSYIILYYIKAMEVSLLNKKIKPIQFNLSFIKKIKSFFSNDIYLDLSKFNGENYLRFFLKGKLIYTVSYFKEELYNSYKNSLENLKVIFGENISVIESRDEAYLIYSQEENKLEFLIKGGEKNIFTEKQKL